MLVETFSLRNIVDSGKYSRGNRDSKPGFQAPCSANDGSVPMPQPNPSIVPVRGPRRAGMNFEYSHYPSIMSNRMPFRGMNRCLVRNCVETPFIPAKAGIQDQPFPVCNSPLWVPASAGTNGGTVVVERWIDWLHAGRPLRK